MSFEPNALLLSFAVGSIGLVLFIYGKKQSRVPQLVAGLLFMVYPYFTESVTSMAIVGALIGAALWWAIRMGW